MIIDKKIKHVAIGNTKISKILSGGGILWEKEKVYRIEWIQAGQTNSNNHQYDNYLYTSYEMVNGEIIPGEKAKYGLWGDLFYYILNGKIIKLKFAKTYIDKSSGSPKQIIVYDIFNGKIIGEYR